MRVVGLILVLVGALALGYEVLRVECEKVAKNNPPALEKTIEIPPVIGGITLVTGLLLTAVASRPNDD